MAVPSRLRWLSRSPRSAWQVLCFRRVSGSHLSNAGSNSLTYVIFVGLKAPIVAPTWFLFFNCRRASRPLRQLPVMMDRGSHAGKASLSPASMMCALVVAVASVALSSEVLPISTLPRCLPVCFREHLGCRRSNCVILSTHTCHMHTLYNAIGFKATTKSDEHILDLQKIQLQKLLNVTRGSRARKYKTRPVVTCRRRSTCTSASRRSHERSDGHRQGPQHRQDQWSSAREASDGCNRSFAPRNDVQLT